ncbi:MAG TPA: hypothetical protein VGR84_18640 [Candidatus Acidoferrales bacterium]|nr:hypothetical protein [Candidatus Acidoferrales bacterium]
MISDQPKMSFPDTKDAQLEIAELRIAEAEVDAVSAEADRIIRGLVGVYKCDFVLTNVPDGMWFPLPDGWQAGFSNPIVPRFGKPPRDYRGPVAVSIATLRRITL